MNDDLHFDRVLAFCDGELPPDEAAEFERAMAEDPALAARVDHEQSLRSCVDQVLRPVSTPANLEQLIRDDWAAASDVDTPVGSVGTPEVQTRPLKISWLAVAAVLVLVVGTIVVSILVPQIDNWQAQPDRLDLRIADTGAHVDAEHTACATDPEHRLRKLIWHDQASAELGIAGHLGKSVTILDYSKLDFEFVAAGPCKIPGEGSSVHLLYQRAGTPDRPGAMLSVFITNDPGPLMDQGEIDPGVTPNCGHVIKIMNDGSLAYLVCCCDPESVGSLADSVATGYGCSGWCGSGNAGSP